MCQKNRHNALQKIAQKKPYAWATFYIRCNDVRMIFSSLTSFPNVGSIIMSIMFSYPNVLFLLPQRGSVVKFKPQIWESITSTLSQMVALELKMENDCLWVLLCMCPPAASCQMCLSLFLTSECRIIIHLM